MDWKFHEIKVEYYQDGIPKIITNEQFGNLETTSKFIVKLKLKPKFDSEFCGKTFLILMPLIETLLVRKFYLILKCLCFSF